MRKPVKVMTMRSVSVVLMPWEKTGSKRGRKSVYTCRALSQGGDFYLLRVEWLEYEDGSSGWDWGVFDAGEPDASCDKACLLAAGGGVKDLSLAKDLAVEELTQLVSP